MSKINGGLKNDQAFNGEWFREASGMETLLEKSHLEGHLLVWYELDLSSLEPLQEDQVKAALSHMYKKVSHMSVCFGKRNGSLWIRRATNPQIDFKVLHDAKAEEVRDTLRTYAYSSESGPLFCARLLPCSPDDCVGKEDLEPSFPHKYHLIFGLHHAFSDGTSNMRLMGFFISLLNDVISNKPINDDEPIGTFVSDAETNQLIEAKKTLLETDPKLRAKVAADYEYSQTITPALFKGFPPPTDSGSDKTVSLVDILDRNTTARFIQRCRQEKATVNSIFTALANVALVDILAEHGCIQESYVIQSCHAVNMRRYWQSNKKALGCHMSFPLLQFTETPKEIGVNEFWEYARTLNQSLVHDVETGRLLEDKALELLEPHSNDHSTDDPRKFGDYVTSNMGDVTAYVTEGGDRVRITNLKRGTTFHKVHFPILINIHTFRGIFTMIFEYSAKFVQSTVAEKIRSQIMNRLREVIE